MATCKRSRPRAAAVPDTSVPSIAEIEDDIPMNRYISPSSLLAASCPAPCPVPCPVPCHDRDERLLLEQLVELSSSQNQLLIDLLGAVNSLTAALLSQQLRL